MKTLRSKMAASYMLIAMIIIASIGISFNVILQRLFMEYAASKQENTVKQIVQQVNRSLEKDISAYSLELFEVIGNAALQSGLVLHIHSNKREVDWDARQHNLEECKLAIEHAEYNLHSVNPQIGGSYQEESFTLNNDLGLLTIGFYGPYSYSDEEVFLIGMINRILIAITVCSLILAIVFAAIMSKRLIEPISSTIATTKKISKGEFGIKASTRSNTNELTELVESVNDMSEQLNRMETLKRSLTSDVAHELRTPLTNLQSQTEAMMDGILPADIARLQSIYSEIERLTQIVNDLQKLTDVEADVIMNRTIVGVYSLFETISRSFEVELTKKGVSLSFECEPTLSLVADHDRMIQIFGNLVSNAMKYTPRGGSISINAYRGDMQNVLFSVKDNGCGIPEQDIPYIFERFYRADKSRTRSTGGAGIGLAITKALVSAHGGQITVKSKVDEGTEFIFSLSDRI